MLCALNFLWASLGEVVSVTISLPNRDATESCNWHREGDVIV